MRADRLKRDSTIVSRSGKVAAVWSVEPSLTGKVWVFLKCGGLELVPPTHEYVLASSVTSEGQQ